MGRSPKPTALKIVSGTDQPSRVRDDEPQPDINKIEMPVGILNASAKREWKRIKKLLLECKVLTNIDNVALAMLCNNIAEMYSLQKKLNEFGMFTKGRYKGIVISPVFTAMNQKQEQVRRMLIEFGMTPSSRTRIGTVGGGGGGDFDF